MKFDVLPDGDYLVQARNLAGQLVLSKKIKASGTNSITLDIPSQTAAGIYHLQVKEINSGKTFSGKLMIQR